MLLTVLSLVAGVVLSTTTTDPNDENRCNFVGMDGEIAAINMCHFGETAGAPWGMVIRCTNNTQDIILEWYDNVDCTGNYTFTQKFLNASDHECENEYCNQLQVTRYLGTDTESDTCAGYNAGDWLTTGCTYDTCANLYTGVVGDMICDGERTTTLRFWDGAMCTGATTTEWDWTQGCNWYNGSGYAYYDVECCEHDFVLGTRDCLFDDTTEEPEEPDTTEESKDSASLVSMTLSVSIGMLALLF